MEAKSPPFSSMGRNLLLAVPCTVLEQVGCAGGDVLISGQAFSVLLRKKKIKRCISEVHATHYCGMNKKHHLRDCTVSLYWSIIVCHIAPFAQQCATPRTVGRESTEMRYQLKRELINFIA